MAMQYIYINILSELWPCASPRTKKRKGLDQQIGQLLHKRNQCGWDR